ncbi:ATP-dependent DNA helicase RecQ [Alphaproteobacteria bacterium]|nr:ATP-dependent DNA helicase RecQ [Alphaproteobacteria bacterium]
MVDSPLRVLNDIFGYKTFRGRQEDIINHVMAGGDGFVLMPTGGGKSLCYQIPAICREGLGVVVSPLIALMQDQVSALRNSGVRAAFLNSTLTPEAAATTARDALGGRLDLLYVSPERFSSSDFQGLLRQAKLALFAIDEAHCVSQWGHDFRPEYLQFGSLKSQFPRVPLLALTATADDATRADIVANLGLAEAREFVASFDRPNLTYTVAPKDGEMKQLLAFIRARHQGDSGIVYCLSRGKVEKVAEALRREGLDALPYHAGMDADARRRNQDAFIRGEGVVMAATVAFGMGIDKPDVRFVAHLDLPKSIEAYYQETGRAGRDGLPADALMLYGMKDVAQLGAFIRESGADEAHKRLERRKLDALLSFAETSACRRKVLLNYFGQSHDGACGNCDNCADPPQMYDAAVPAQKLLSCVYRTGGRFGAGHIVKILRGQEDAKIQRFGHDKLSTFGIGQDLSAAQWQALARQLAMLGLVEVNAEYQTLELGEGARDFLRGGGPLMVRRLAAHPAAAVAAVRGAKADAGLAEGSDAKALFARLKALRMRLAKGENLAPYMVFHDKTLLEMVERRPCTLAAMEEISGVGGRKLTKYGQIFLEALNRPA